MKQVFCTFLLALSILFAGYCGTSVLPANLAWGVDGGNEVQDGGTSNCQECPPGAPMVYDGNGQVVGKLVGVNIMDFTGIYYTLVNFTVYPLLIKTGMVANGHGSLYFSEPNCQGMLYSRGFVPIVYPNSFFVPDSPTLQSEWTTQSHRSLNNNGTTVCTNFPDPVVYQTGTQFKEIPIWTAIGPLSIR